MDISEDSSDIESVSTLETFDKLLNNMNGDILSNQEINVANVVPTERFYINYKYQNFDDDPIYLFILYRVFDSFIFLFLILAIFFVFLSLVALIFEIVISFYSVIMMNYVFFVSSIVSYVMAPIYHCLAKDWLNFAFSFTQVFLSSPLIAFYIFYILKSVKNLGSFIEDIPETFKKVSFVVILASQDLCQFFLEDFCDKGYGIIFDCEDVRLVIIIFLISSLFLAIVGALAYIEFCFDKTIILFGIICYVITTLQIFILIIPSYLYSIQTLFCHKSVENNFVLKYFDIIKEIENIFIDDDDDQKSIKNISELEESNDNDFSSEDESDSIINNDLKRKNLIKEKEDNNRKEIKIIDDSDISDYVDDAKKMNKYIEEIGQILYQLIAGKNYFCIYDYSKTIAFDHHQKTRKFLFTWLFLLLNLAVVSYDIYQLTQNYNPYFLAAVIIRFIFIPLFSYYNIFSMICYRSKNSVLNGVLIAATVLTGIVVILILACFSFKTFYQNKYRINNLEYFRPLNNITIANPEMIKHPICEYNIYDVSAFDAFGYSLGGYDVNRNKTVFDNQMKIFFNENYSSHINYSVHSIDNHFLFIKYYDSLINTHVFAFRGYNSGPEIAFQLEILAERYIVPFFEDIVPFYELINDYWLEFYTDFLNSFGLKFFDNNNLIIKYVDSIIDIYNNERLDDEERVLFAGINCGGVIAKIIGTLLHRKSISFISFPIDNDLFNNMFDFQPSFMSLATNVYNVDGFFSGQEPKYATNIGIDMPVFDQTKFCTSGVCEINSKTDNVYRTFCTISETCGKGNRFHDYCENIIGEKDLETIRQHLMETD